VSFNGTCKYRLRPCRLYIRRPIIEITDRKYGRRIAKEDVGLKTNKAVVDIRLRPPHPLYAFHDKYLLMVILTNRQFQWTGNGHSQLPLAELGKPSPNIDLLRSTGSTIFTV